MVDIIAHRGFSGRWPESTRAAYHEAIDWSRREQVGLGVECDVQFSADGELICLHDLTVDRTSDGHGPAYALTLAQLRDLDFGGERGGEASALTTLTELLDLIAAARAGGVPVTAVIETKHPNPRGTAVEEEVARLFRHHGWIGAGAPVRLLSFSAEALTVAARLLPEVERTFLIEAELGPWWDGHLPAGARTCGLDLAVLRADPDYVARAARHGNGVNVWTVNKVNDIAFCLELGVSGLTTDHPDRVLRAIRVRGRG